MLSDRSSSRPLPIEELPPKHRDGAAQALSALEAREREASAARAAAAESVLAEGRARLDNLLSKKKLATLRRAMAGERRRRDDMREPPASLTADPEKAAKRRTKSIDGVLGKLGVDAKDLRSIGRDTESKLRKVVGPPAGSVTKGFNLARNLDKWQELSPLHNFPLDWGVQPPIDGGDSGFQLFRPPFDFAIQHFDRVESSHFRVRFEVVAFESAGALGNKVMMDCDDAGSFDLAHGILDNEMVVVYEAPASGRVQIIVDGMNTFGHHDLRIEDEFGFSSHWTTQHNYLHTMIYHSASSEPSLALMAEFSRSGNEDRTWSERALTPGQHYYAVVTTSEMVKAGDTFFVGVGSRTFDITRANDVEVHSKSNFQWLVRSAEIRVVP